MEPPADAGNSSWIEIHDLDALPEADDKVEECRYFLSLIESENDWRRFRWLTSAFLGAAYSFFETQALRSFFSFWHPETGEPIENDEALGVLGQYVRVVQNPKRPSFVKTAGVHPITDLLYKLRNANTHSYPLTIRSPNVSSPELFQFGGHRERGKPVVQFCREVFAIIEELNQKLEQLL
jgi:hypothetical protein